MNVNSLSWNNNVDSFRYEERDNSVRKSNEFTYLTIKIAPNKNPMSPILLTNRALRAALFAAILKNQKLINRYEQIPTPSQPINS
jgi:hypothetical protein